MKEIGEYFSLSQLNGQSNTKQFKIQDLTHRSSTHCSSTHRSSYSGYS